MRDAIRACTPSTITVTRSSDEGCNQSVYSEHNHRDERAATHGASGGQDAEDVRVLVVPNEERNSYAISGHRRQSDAIRCNQMQSDAIRCNQRGLELGNVREATPTKWSEVAVGVEGEAEVGDPGGERRFVDEPVPPDSDERAALYRSSCGEDGEDGLLVVPVDGGGAGGEEVLAIEGDGHLWKDGRRSERVHAWERKCLLLRAMVTCQQRALSGHSEGNQKAISIRGKSEGTQRALRGHSEGTQRALRGHSEGNQRAHKAQRVLRDGNCHLNLRRATHAHEIDIWSDEIEIWSNAAYKRACAAPTPARNSSIASAASAGSAASAASAAAAVGTAATGSTVAAFSARDL
jgi:hypothetical protein